MTIFGRLIVRDKGLADGAGGDGLMRRQVFDVSKATPTMAIN